MPQSSPVNENLLKRRLTELEAAGSWAPEVSRGWNTSSARRTTTICSGSTRSSTRAAGLAEAEAIELFVHAAKVGLFEMDWLLLCAYCPQIAGGFRELDQVHPRFQCAFCNALNDVALDDYIQVAFTVSEKVRDIVFRHPEALPVEDYYLRYNFAKGFKPPHGMTPAQIIALLSRQFADLEAARAAQLRVRRHRRPVRDPGSEPQAAAGVLRRGRGGLAAEHAGPARRRPVPGARAADRAAGTWSWATATSPSARRAICDRAGTGSRSRTAWPSAAGSGSSSTRPGSQPHPVEYEPFLSGKRLLLSPCFGELYKGQLVDEGEGITVSDITYLFTDLKESTPLYDSVGDLNAFFLVRQHFEILNRIVRGAPARSSRRSATR